jgi:hypothetical protein
MSPVCKRVRGVINGPSGVTTTVACTLSVEWLPRNSGLTRWMELSLGWRVRHGGKEWNLFEVKTEDEGWRLGTFMYWHAHIYPLPVHPTDILYDTNWTACVSLA